MLLVTLSLILPSGTISITNMVRQMVLIEMTVWIVLDMVV